MFERGKRGLALGGIVMLLTAAAHSMGVALSSHGFDALHPSGRNRFLDWGLFLRLVYTAFGALTLLRLRQLPAGHGALKALAWTGLLLCVSAAALALALHLPPPLIFFTAAGLCFAGSAFTKPA